MSRGHFIRENPEYRTSIAPSEIGAPASSPGDGTLFLALVVIHCEKHNIEWSAQYLSKWWWKEKGVCSIPDACITNIEEGNIIINTEKFLIWAKTIIESVNYIMTKKVELS